MTRGPRTVLATCALLLLAPARATAFSGDLFDIGLGGACPGGLIEWLVNTPTGPGPCVGEVYDGVTHVCGTNTATGVDVEIVETQTVNADGTTDISVTLRSADGSDLFPEGLVCPGGVPIVDMVITIAKEILGIGQDGDPLDPQMEDPPNQAIVAEVIFYGAGGVELGRAPMSTQGAMLTVLQQEFTLLGVGPFLISAVEFHWLLDGVTSKGSGGTVATIFPPQVTVPDGESQPFELLFCLHGPGGGADLGADGVPGTSDDFCSRFDCPIGQDGTPDYGPDGTPGTSDDACAPPSLSLTLSGNIGLLDFDPEDPGRWLLDAQLPPGVTSDTGQVVPDPPPLPLMPPFPAAVEVRGQEGGATVLKTAEPEKVGPGQEIVYTIVVQNGDQDASSVDVFDVLPPQFVDYVGFSAPGWDCLENPLLLPDQPVPFIALFFGPHLDCLLPGILPANTSAPPIQITVRAGQTPRVVVNHAVAEVDGGYAHDDAEVEITDAVGLTVTKQAAPDPVESDQQLRYTIVVENVGVNPAADITVVDTLPPGYQVVDQEGAIPWICDPQSGQTITCRYIDTLAPGASTGELVLVVELPDDAPGGTSINSVAVSDTEVNDDDDSAQAPVEVIPVADIFAVKEAEPAEVVVDTGDPLDRRVIYTLRVINIGPGPAEDVTVTDTLPDGVTHVSGPPNCTAVGQVVTCDLGDIPPPPDNVREVDIIVEVDPAFLGQSICNRFSVATAGSVDRFPSNDTSDDACVRAVPTVELALSKMRTSPATQVGVPITYEVIVTNTSATVPAEDVVVTDLLPSSVTDVSASATQGTCDVQLAASRIVCDIGTLAPGQSATVTVQMTPLAPGQLCNTASVDADALPPGGEAPQVCDDIEVGPDVAIFKAFIPNPADPVLRQEIAFEIELTATNGGTAPVVNVQISDALPPDVSFIGFTAGSTGCSYDPATRVVSCGPGGPWATLGPGESRSVRFAARYSGRGELCNIAQVSTTTTQPTANDSTETCEDFAPTVDLRLVKSGPPRFVGLGQRIVYTLEATNPGPGDASSVQIVDLVPAGLSLVSASFSRSGGPPQQCGEQAGDAVCNVGPMPVGDQVIVTVEVDTTAPGEACDRGDIAASPETERNVEDNSPEYCNEVIVGLADLQVVKLSPGLIPVLGQPFDFTIEVTNLGPDTATGVVLDDVLAFELGFDGASFVRDGDPPGTPPTACPQDPATRNVRCAIGALAPTEVATVTISVVPQFADIEFCNTASADLTGEFDPDPSNNVSPRVGEAPLCLTATNDRDADGVADDIDNCPDFPNPGQADTDGNGIGDACECGDQNGDGTVDVLDILELNLVIFDIVPAGPLADANGDGMVNIADILAVNAKIFGAPAFCPPRTAPPPGP